MRLANGFEVDVEKTLGELKFSAMRRERFVMDADNKPTEEVKERTYDLRSRGQGMMIQVSVPATVDIKEFPPMTEVELVNSLFGTVTTANFMGAEAEWYIKADDIIVKQKGGATRPNEQPKQEIKQEKK